MPTAFTHQDSIDRLILVKALIDSAFAWATSGMPPASPSGAGTYWGEVCNNIDKIIAEAFGQGLKDHYGINTSISLAEIMELIKARSLTKDKNSASSTSSLKAGKIPIITHILHQGEAYCGSVKGSPRTWPVGHEWVPKANADKSNCLVCCAKMLEGTKNSPK